MIDVVLPEATYAEQVLIQAILWEPHRISEVVDVLAPEDFTLEKHRIIWAIMLKLHQSGARIEAPAIYMAMSEQQRESVGGIAALAEFVAVQILQIQPYVAKIRDVAIRRRLILGARKLLLGACEQSASADEILTDARALVMGLESRAEAGDEFMTPTEAIQDAGGIDAYLRQGAEAGIPFPWEAIQSSTGGMMPGDLIILAADTGRGKTAAALNLALYAAERGYGMAIFSMEMSRRQLLNRLMSLAGRFNSFVFKQRERRVMEEHDIARAAGQICDLPLYIRDSSACTVPKIISGVQRLRARGREVRMVVVDYLQLLTGEGRSRTEIVGGIARGLKNAAMELGVPVIALSQLSRDHSKCKTIPELHDLRESGDIEQAANMVLFLHGETSYSAMPNELLPIDMYIAKQRDGQARIRVPLLFRADCGYFQEVA